jgi:hypothetical protein
MRIPRRLSLTLYACLVLATVAAAHSGDRKTLVVRGRTIDGGGFPVGKTRVWIDGLPKVSAMSDADGRYSIAIPIGTPDEIGSKSLRLAVRAEHKGWRFEIPGGDAMLALELGVERGAGGTAQCVAHSNLDRFAAAAAGVVAADGEGSGLTEINFLGTKSNVTGEASWPALSQTARVSLDFPLGGSAPASGPAVQSAPSPAATTTRGASSGAATTGASAAPSARAGKPAVPAAAPKSGAGAAKASGAAVGVKKTRPKDKDGTPSDDAAQELAKMHASAARESVKAVQQAAAKRDPVAVLQERARIALDRTAHITGPDSGVRDSVAIGTPRVVPAPSASESRSRSAPLVIRAARRLASASDSCECRISGTVEVQSDEPLKRPERIEVSLVWYPQVRDTVELFMGSPRPFELGPTHCGPQRLHLKVLTSGRFDVRSRDAMAGFHCDGRVADQRLVLVPR